MKAVLQKTEEKEAGACVYKVASGEKLIGWVFRVYRSACGWSTPGGYEWVYDPEGRERDYTKPWCEYKFFGSLREAKAYVAGWEK